MSEEMIEQYHKLMQQKKYSDAGNLVLEHFDDLIDIARKYHQNLANSKDPVIKEGYQQETPGELIMLLDTPSI